LVIRISIVAVVPAGEILAKAPARALTCIEPDGTDRQESQAKKVQKNLESVLAVPRGDWCEVVLEGLHPGIQDVCS
jgi:hypothetical protein